MTTPLSSAEPDLEPRPPDSGIWVLFCLDFELSIQTFRMEENWASLSPATVIQTSPRVCKPRLRTQLAVVCGSFPCPSLTWVSLLLPGVSDILFFCWNHFNSFSTYTCNLKPHDSVSFVLEVYTNEVIPCVCSFGTWFFQHSVSPTPFQVLLGS